MNTGAALRLGAYGAGLVLAFGAAFAVGGGLAPVVGDPGQQPSAAPGDGNTPGAGGAHDDMGDPHEDPGAEPDAGAGGDDGSEDGGHGDDHGEAAVTGLASSLEGYTLVPDAATLPAGGAVPFGFTVVGPDGHAVTDYTESHEKDLHLIVVRRDLAGFQHVHPEVDAEGRWSVPLNLSAAGSYRVFADFVTADGKDLTLGADVAVAGDFAPVPLPAPAVSATVDGYEVTLAGDEPVAGEEATLEFTIRKDGAEVTDLQPYLGAFGHLVSLRAGDLAYLHTHPEQEAAAGQAGGPGVEFATTFPTDGDYRLYLDFQHDGEVRTAEVTVRVATGHGH